MSQPDTPSSATAQVQAALDTIESLEPRVRAWTHLATDHAQTQATALDAAVSAGAKPGPLHGMPVAIKDIIDTADMPTENGCGADAGRQPAEDAWVVRQLKASGAVVVGKSVTTEVAYRHPGATTNPHNAAHTPGGSSSGSAAAVACGMVPIAVGTQTGGSVIRPAAFCGVVGYKPTFGWVPRPGVLCQSHTLDTVGFFARSVEDVARIGAACTGADSRDSATAPRSVAQLLDTVMSEGSRPPHLAFAHGPAWATASDDTKQLLPEFAATPGDKGAHCESVSLPGPFDDILEAHAAVHMAEFANHYKPYGEHGKSISDDFRAALERGASVTAVDYQRALALREAAYQSLHALLDRFDALLVPAAAGEAPEGLDWTGDPAFNAPWTLLGMPCVTVPLLTGSKGLPIGVQIVGARNDDARVLRIARWLEKL